MGYGTIAPPSVTPEQRQAARREIVRQVEQGMSATDARLWSPVAMHRTTVYWLLKRVQREGEQVFIEGRHGHPVKLRGEIPTFLLDYCQSHPSAPSAGSRDLLCKRLHQFTAKVITNPLFHLLSGQKPGRFDNRSLAVDPLWLNSVEPGTLDGQPVWDDAYTTFARASLLQHRLSGNLMTNP